MASSNSTAARRTAPPWAHTRSRARARRAVAAGELGGVAVGELGKADKLERPHRALPDDEFGRAPNAQPVGDIVEHGHVRPQRVALEHHPDIAVLGIAMNFAFDRGDDFSVDADFARIRPLQARKAAQHRRLTATGRSEQGDEFPLRDRKAHITYRRLGAEIFSDTVELDHGMAAHVHGSTASVRSGSSLRYTFSPLRRLARGCASPFHSKSPQRTRQSMQLPRKMSCDTSPSMRAPSPCSREACTLSGRTETTASAPALISSPNGPGQPHRGCALHQLHLATAGRGDLDDAPLEQVGGADEVADIGVDRPGVDLLWAAFLHDASLAHHDDLVAHDQRLGLIIGDVDGGDADFVLDAFPQLNAHLLAQLGVEIRQRLVEREGAWDGARSRGRTRRAVAGRRKA